jgi:hypothetical protein
MKMNVLMVIQDTYGQRMVDAVKQYGPQDWTVNQIKIPLNLPAIIDDASAFLPEIIPSADILISLGENPGVAQMIPDIAEKSGAKIVIAPADNRIWLPAGLARQIKQILQKKQVEMVYPVPFCSLSQKDSQNKYFQEFARFIGRPEVDISLGKSAIEKVNVIRSAPCGNTYYVAEHLPGVVSREAIEQSGLMHHQYPCMATMVMDKEFEDTLMHRAGLMTKLAVEFAIKATTEKTDK